MSKTTELTADLLLEGLWESKGTDLLITADACPMVRVDGDLRPAGGFGPISAVQTEALLVELLTPDQLETFHLGREVDFSFTWREVARLRGNAFLTKGEAGLSLRAHLTPADTVLAVNGTGRVAFYSGARVRSVAGGSDTQARAQRREMAAVLPSRIHPEPPAAEHRHSPGIGSG